MSKIQWTDKTWNPSVGCAKVSAGCRDCYAERDALRVLRQMQGRSGSSPTEKQRAVIDAYSEVVTITESGKGRWNGRAVPVGGDRLEQPLRWRSPSMVFVNSMSDLFHEDLPFEWIAAVFGVMAASPRHTFQVLTKRPERAFEFFRWVDLEAQVRQRDDDRDTKRTSRARLLWEMAAAELSNLPAHMLCDIGAPWPLSNIVLGVSVENQATADERIPLLLQCPAAVRFVSYEPALGPVDFSPWLPRHAVTEAGDCAEWCKACGPDGPVRGLDWIIVGGESGPTARPFDIAWAELTVSACRAAGVPVFVKQLGSCPVRKAPEGHRPIRLSDRKGGDMDEWPAELRVRESPPVEVVLDPAGSYARRTT